MVMTALKSGETPYQMWYGKKPNLQHTRVFGCMVYTHVPKEKRKKLNSRAQKLRFIGYTDTASNYKVWDEKTRRSYIRYDVIFNESDFGQNVATKPAEEKLAKLEFEVKNPEECERSEEQQMQEENVEEEPEVRSQRVKKPVVRFGIDDYADISTAETQHVAFRASKIDEPATIEEALSGDHCEQWKVAADAKYQSLMENNTWELVKLPEGRKAIGCKCVFRVKHDGKGRVKTFKGRLVAQGYTQK